jgi:hypothetical protein
MLLKRKGLINLVSEEHLFYVDTGLHFFLGPNLGPDADRVASNYYI